MDDQLKQRLWGATVLVALAVIFVPMLFDEKGEGRGGITSTNIPPLPSEVQEREITLPAMPDEGKQEAEAGAGSETRERAGYRIIPLDDPHSVAEATKTSPTETPTEGEKRVEEMPAEFGADEGGGTDELPTRDSPLAKVTRSPGAPPGSPPVKSGGRGAGNPAVSVQEQKRTAPAKAAPTSGSRSASPPKTSAVKPQPKREMSSPSVPKPEGSAAPRPKSAGAPTTPAPALPARLPQANKIQAKSTEQTATAAKPSDDKGVVVGKPVLAPGAKGGSVAAEQRKGASDTVATSKSSKAAETAKRSDAGRSSSEGAKPGTAHRPSEPKTDSKLAAGAKPAQSVAENAVATKAGSPKPSDTTKAKVPEGATEVTAKKRPEPSANTTVASAPSAAAAAKSWSPKPSPASKVAESATKAKLSDGPSAWVIRAGSFTSESGAKALADKLKKQNFAAYVQKVSGENGSIYRVQVGPELEKNRAEQTQKRLETSAGIRGILVSHH